MADGRVKQSLFSQNGCEKSLYILQAGEIFGEMDYFNNSKARIINKVLEDCQVAVIKKERLEKKLAVEPKIYRYFIHSISRKFRIVMLQLSGLVFNDSAGKLAEILIRLAAQEGKQSQLGVIIDLKLTHQEISDLIGCSRSTISRELNNFKKENIITTDSKKIIIKDPTALRSYINPICK